jgi:hypothetical protein
MILIDRVRLGLAGQNRHAWRSWLPSADVDHHAPLIVVVVVGAGLLLLILTTPTTSSDLGQWLMTSRYYLGEEVPAYRTISALPPLVPLLLAAIRSVIPDPFVALHVLNAVLLLGLGASFYVLGTVLLHSRWAGALSVVLALFATDRFLELFAFGGLLQVAAMTGMAFSVAAFARAARGPGIVSRWWWLGTAGVGIAALSHAATGLLAVAVGVVVAALAAIAQRHVGWRALVVALGPLALTVIAIAAYWALVLLPANADYIANPASLAYRGPDRLFSLLVGQWPSAALLVLGVVSLAIGAGRAWLSRRIDGYVVLLVWVAVTWGALIVSVVNATGTDYPRFATPMIAPIAVAAAAGALWLLNRLVSSITKALPRWPTNTVMAALIMASVVVTTPMVVARHGHEADYYDLRDATALTAAATWVDQRLGTKRRAVLSDVREGKWIEGLTGREALFSQPVRYAFRRTEWQRSVDADALMRSTVALTSGFIGVFFTDSVAQQGRVAPAGIVLRANHGGEFLDLLRVRRADITIITDHGAVRGNALVPLREVESASQRQVSLSTVWTDRRGTQTLAQSVTIWRDGTSMRLSQYSPDNGIATVLRPAGLPIVSVERRDQETTVCFTQFGVSHPCLRIWVSQTDASVRQLPDGGLRIETGRPDRLDIVVTALTAGDASVGLSLLHPEDLIAARDIGAALLYALDPAYPARAHRLETLGFQEEFAAGPYRVLMREGTRYR